MDPTALTLPTIPPLSVANLEALEVYEMRLRTALTGCMVLDSLIFNQPKADAYLRSYTIEIFDFYYGCYKDLHGYEPMWVHRLQVDTVVRILTCFVTQLPHQSHLAEKYKEELIDLLFAHAGPLNVFSGSAESTALTNLAWSDRTALKSAYLARFPEVKILDICWAARQRYSEWKRWLRGAVKDGSTPDIAFRKILSSEKPPREHRTQPRPNGWK